MKDRKTICLKRLVLSRFLNLLLVVILMVLTIKLIDFRVQSILSLNNFLKEDIIDWTTWQKAQLRNLIVLGKEVTKSIVIWTIVRVNLRFVMDEIIIRLFPLESIRLNNYSGDTLDDLEAFDVDVHGENFLEFCAASRYEEIEFTASFDRNGQKMAECTSYKDSVVRCSTKFLSEEHKNSSAVDVHCHPDRAETAHSPIDFGYAVDQIRYSVVVTRHYTYIIEDLHHDVILRAMTGHIMERRIEKEYYSNRIWHFIEKTSLYTGPILSRYYTIFVCRRVAKRYRFRFTVRPAWKDDLAYLGQLLTRTTLVCKLAKR